MENHSTEDHEQGRVYHYRKTSWLGIVFLFLMLMAILGWAARYYTLPPWGAWLVLLFLIWLVLVARLALPWSIVAISISREKITLQQKNGKEITRVTEMTGINERGGRVMQIKGLTPSSKKTSIAITRDQLGKEQYKDFRDYLRQSFPDAVQVFPPIGAVRKGFGWFNPRPGIAYSAVLVRCGSSCLYRERDGAYDVHLRHLYCLCVYALTFLPPVL